MRFSKLLAKKSTFFLLILVLIFLGSLKFKQWKSQRAIDLEKESLIEQTQKLEQKNKEFKDSLSYLSSGSFKEKVAREQLNLKKQDELVFSFTESLGATTSTSSEIILKSSNFEKWIQYFKNDN